MTGGGLGKEEIKEVNPSFRARSLLFAIYI